MPLIDHDTYCKEIGLSPDLCAIHEAQVEKNYTDAKQGCAWLFPSEVKAASECALSCGMQSRQPVAECVMQYGGVKLNRREVQLRHDKLAGVVGLSGVVLMTLAYIMNRKANPRR